jgi:hypothetical protein
MLGFSEFGSNSNRPFGSVTDAFGCSFNWGEGKGGEEYVAQDIPRANVVSQICEINASVYLDMWHEWGRRGTCIGYW